MADTRDHIGARTAMIGLGDGIEAYLALPSAGAAPYRGVILGHERYGLAQHTLDLAARFASYGYACIAPDMTAHWDGDKEALLRGETSLSITPDQIKDYYSRCLDHLLGMQEVDPSRIAAMGVCMSGHYPLLLNTVRKEVKANIVFYGAQRDRAPEEVIAQLSAPVLGVFGEKDSGISVDDVLGLRTKLEKHRKSFEIKIYRGGPHGWLNDTMPGRYRQMQAEAAWAHLMDFLDRVYLGLFPAGAVRWRFESETAADYDFTRNVRLA